MSTPALIKSDPKPRPSVRGRFEQVLSGRFGKLLEKVGFAPKGKEAAAAGPARLIDLAERLLSFSGKASGPTLASAFFDLYEGSPLDERREFLREVRGRFPRVKAEIDAAVARWQESPDESTARALHASAESPCQRLIRLLNLAPDGTRRLIAMREDLLTGGKLSAAESALDADFQYIFTDWFNAGFLELRKIDWQSPAALLERVIRYEAVHQIESWDDLRRRLEPVDRRCYAFFHPQMMDDPLIFVEVALTKALPDAIAAVLADAAKGEREMLDPRAASHAIFYSISNCQKGLRGVPFGNFLIKRVVELLKAELPQLSGFATLSPVPGYARWLAGEDVGELDSAGLRAQAARYLVKARGKSGGPLDSVARFHLGNGARLEAVHADADLSAKGLKESHGVMVNYYYDLDKIEPNLLSLTELDEVACSPVVAALVREAAGAAKAA